MAGRKIAVISGTTNQRAVSDQSLQHTRLAEVFFAAARI
jgi:hypothetical protein